MEQIIELLENIEYSILFPIHPRTEKKLKEFGLWNRVTNIPNIRIIAPLGYVETVYLQSNCKMILTDSGGISKESYFAGAKCLYMLNTSGWADLWNIGWITCIDFDNSESVGSAVKMLNEESVPAIPEKKYYGEGSAASVIVDILEKQNFL